MAALNAVPGFKFGCDPELFIINDKEEYVSAAGLIPGTKAEPFPVKCGAVQVDGMAAEFNIDPAVDFNQFNHNIATVLSELKKMLPAGHRLVAEPAVEFSKEVFEEAPPEAKELGCTPDFNAWTGEVNPPPEPSGLTAHGCSPRLRTASGHLHIGWTEDEDASNVEHIQNCNDLVKQLDWYLGAWSLERDQDARRRLLYGKAGACRYKPYGVEYRVLSNFWVLSGARRLDVWNRMQKAIRDMRERFYPEVAADFNNTVIQAINTNTLDPTLRAHFSYPVRFIN